MLIKTDEQVLFDKQFLKPALEENTFLLTVTNGSEEMVVKVYIAKVEHGEKNADNVSEWIDDWRKAWAGKRDRKSMGDRNKCIKVMTEFLKEHKYTIEDVYRARDVYIKSFDGNYETMRQADHYIKKKENGIDVSDLLSNCQELEILDTSFGDDFVTSSIYKDL